MAERFNADATDVFMVGNEQTVTKAVGLLYLE